MGVIGYYFLSSIIIQSAVQFSSDFQSSVQFSLVQFSGILMWKLRRKIGAAIVRANVMLLMDRVAHTGGDAAAAYSRQSRAESRFFRGGDPAEASYAHRQPRWQARALPPSWAATDIGNQTLRRATTGAPGQGCIRQTSRKLAAAPFSKGRQL